MSKALFVTCMMFSIACGNMIAYATANQTLGVAAGLFCIIIVLCFNEVATAIKEG